MRYLSNKETGVTLIELTVVLLILVALAGIAIPYISGTGSAAMCKATDVTMQNLKKVIMDRYYLDTLGHFPSDKYAADYNLRYLFIRDDGLDNNGDTKIDRVTNGGADIDTEDAWQPFDPTTQTGWRGSYLQGGVNNEVLDGWGNPIRIEVLSENDCKTKILLSATIPQPDYCARLISGGADSTITTTANRTGDDRVLYLQIPIPVNNGEDGIEKTSDDNTVNPSCDEN
jgi:type II secretory pathway pseudopilin PulG